MIWNCAQFKKDLIESEPKKIQGELSLKLEALSLLSEHDKIDDAWEDLKKVVASMISIQKINSYRNLISRYGVDWYKEYYENKKDDEKVNPVKLIADVWGNSDKIGFDCKEKNGEWKGYFDECDEEIKTADGKNAKVVRVLKPTVGTGRWIKRDYFVPVSRGQGNWVSNKQIESSLRSRHSGTISSKGKLGELVVETCDHKNLTLFLISSEGPESIFCKEILQKFFGDDVSDKRYCLYEMPDTEEDFTSTEFFKKWKND